MTTTSLPSPPACPAPVPTGAPVLDPGLRERIRAAALVRTDPLASAPLVISNRVLHAGFDALGFMNPTASGRLAVKYAPPPPASATVVSSPPAIVLAVIRSHVADAHPLRGTDCRAYHQEFDRLAGTLITTYDLFGPTRITACAPVELPNLMLYRVQRTPESTGRILHLEIEAETSAVPALDGVDSDASTLLSEAPSFSHAQATRDQVVVTSRFPMGMIRWIVHCPGAKLEVRGTHVHVRLDVGANGSCDHTLRLWIERTGGVGEEVLQQAPADLLAANTVAWSRWWAAHGAPASAGAAALGAWAGDVLPPA